MFETDDVIKAEPLDHKRLYRFALVLAVFTIVYNLAEGIIATWFGFHDESATLFGFGVDSFIELIDKRK